MKLVPGATSSVRVMVGLLPAKTVEARYPPSGTVQPAFLDDEQAYPRTLEDSTPEISHGAGTGLH